MPRVLVDTSVILDVATEDATWFAWSSEQIEQLAGEAVLCINKIIYAEVSIGYERIEQVETALSPEFFERLPIPYEALFLAGKAFLKYRRRKETKRRPLPDFYIGAHAAVEDMLLLTRDAGRIHDCFPSVQIISPTRT